MLRVARMNHAARKAVVAPVEDLISTPEEAAVRPQRPERDLRLDFFRGIALIFIFIDHIPKSVVSSFTLRAVAFCDAAEAFIFISGFAAALVYGSILRHRGLLVATAQIYRRIWQLYVAHVFVFVLYVALITYVLGTTGHPGFAEEMGASGFLNRPDAMIGKLLLLQFQPGLFNILPLYMLLLAAFPLALLLLRWNPFLALLPSLLLYGADHLFGWTLYLYPDHRPWFFSPLAWQLIFVIGAVCGTMQSSGRRIIPERGWIVALAAVIVAVCGVISVTHDLHSIFDGFPQLVPQAPWDSEPDKTHLSLLRLVNFLALVILAARLVRRDAAFLSSPLVRPLVLCGQNSLYIFCLSIVLSAVAYFVLDEITGRLRMQVLVTAAGITVMICAAYLISWYKQAGRSSRSFVPRVVPE